MDAGKSALGKAGDAASKAQSTIKGATDKASAAVDKVIPGGSGMIKTGLAMNPETAAPMAAASSLGLV